MPYCHAVAWTVNPRGFMRVAEPPHLAAPG